MRSVPRLRSLLFAPAVRPDFVERLGERGADAVVIDCEDATPANAKAEGRANAARLAPVLAASGVAVTVRVNAQPTEWFVDDVREGLSDALVAVVVPKVESLAGLDAVDAALSAAGFDDLGVIAGLETALGVADSRQLLAHPRVVAGYFGAEDFIARHARATTGAELPMEGQANIDLSIYLHSLANGEPIKVDLPTPQAKAATASRREAAASPRPIARPTITEAAPATPIGTMKVMLANERAISCPASEIGRAHV